MCPAAVQRVLELGTYCGYGAIRIAITLPDDGKVYTVDPDVRRRRAGKGGISTQGQAQGGRQTT
jgi:predicted O-methyltransferase YrrM